MPQLRVFQVPLTALLRGEKTAGLILASASPRRRELLAMAGVPFEVLTSGADEGLPPGILLDKAVLELSRRKAAAVRALPQSAGKIILAADTVVELQGRILGKPHSREQAAQMLRALSGRTHRVYTGVCLLGGDEKSKSFYECTEVTFYPLSGQEIDWYVSTGEPMDKAGAYGIQGAGALLVEGIRGDYYNVMGLPLARVVRELAQLLRC